MSSLRNGLNSTFRLTTRNCTGLFYLIRIFMEDLVLPALHLSTLNAGMMHQVRLRMFLFHVLPLAVHLKFVFDRQVGGTILKLSYFLNFFVGPLLHA